MPQQFSVPQFIDAEDKIMGPITVRQFLILIVVALISFLTWKLADLALAGILIFLWVGSGLVLAFAKINGQQFHIFLLNVIKTKRKPGLRVWHKEYSSEELKMYSVGGTKKFETKLVARKEVKRSRLSELSLMVNTGGAYNPEDYE